MGTRYRRGPKGLFVAFEGGEGVGKTTQIKSLAAWLRSHRRQVTVTREPGGSRLGRAIRRLLLGTAGDAPSPRAELLLYEADRAHHMDRVVRPALAEGKIVLTDRSCISSSVYQGICRGLGLRFVESLNRAATGGLMPDLVFVLDLPETEGLGRKRKQQALDRLESESRAFHRKVRKGFLMLARRNRSRFRVIDARQPKEAIALEIRAHVARRLRMTGDTP